MDLFCGRGGWARGFLEAGFDVVGFDLVDQSKHYPGEFVQADVRDLTGQDFRGARVVVASPPCQQFSLWNYQTRDPARGMVLVREAVRFILEAQPTYWAIENVRGAVGTISAELGPPRIRNRPWYVWGEFPGFLVGTSQRMFKGELREPRQFAIRRGPEAGRVKTMYRWGWKGADRAAMIPLELARPLAQACLP